MEEELRKFEEYTDGSMSEQERIAFEQELDEKPDFKNSYQQYLDMQQYLGDRDRKEDALNRLQDIHSEFSDKDLEKSAASELKKKRSSSIIWLGLILVLLVLVLLFFGKFFDKPLTPQSIYASEFAVPSMMLKTKGPQALTGYNQKGFQAFADYKFDLALQLLDTIGTEYDPAVQSQILLAQAISFSETESYQQSEAYFNFLREKFPHMNATANWYQGLSYLKRSEVDQAKAILKRIPTSSSYFQRAKEIQDSI